MAGIGERYRRMDESHERPPETTKAPKQACECSTCSLLWRLSLTFPLGLVVMAIVAVSARVLPGDPDIWTAVPFAQDLGHKAAVFVPYVLVPFLAIGLTAAIVNYFLGSHGGFQWWGEFAGLGAAAVSVVWSLEVVFNRTYTAGVKRRRLGQLHRPGVGHLPAGRRHRRTGRSHHRGASRSPLAILIPPPQFSSITPAGHAGMPPAHIGPPLSRGGPPALERLNARP